ncbi:LysM peptidoglycan-binding domain-containing protein [Tissierella creatinophila]|uniref:Cell division suppressor protein YneA n=1 Tax=Tissierella creatinophila DSM 6911 TaxID=1123403 RepID=A0A1U7M9M1_TISCR|nr:LysM peptidoglycan-binding domain-containing protein [Tissierella creatinophila]OLS03971.1 cell division suppressor protein YneA [Tissierella creatinophila DSM 6911]
MKKYKIVNKTRFYVFIIFIVYFIFSTLSFFKSFGRAEYILSNVKYKEVYISKGDTVWDIALEYKPDKSDVRDMVAKIRDVNKMENLSIKPGDVIKVPLRKK